MRDAARPPSARRTRGFDVKAGGGICLLGGRAGFFVDVMGCFLSFGESCEGRIRDARRSRSADLGGGRSGFGASTANRHPDCIGVRLISALATR